MGRVMTIEKLKSYIPESLEVYERLEAVPQHHDWHGEGNVQIHTDMVIGEVQKVSDRWLDTLAAYFHDFGKLYTTVSQDGKWVAPKHTKASYRDVIWFMRQRDYLNFKDLSYVANTARYHGKPIYALENDNAEKTIITLSQKMGGLDYFLNVVRADWLGRICDDLDDKMYQVECFALAAEELGCLEAPYGFSNSHHRFMYYNGGVSRYAELYDDTRGRLLIMCGLPGSGKNTALPKNFPDVESVIELDHIRKEMGARRGDSKASGHAVQEADRRLKEGLAKGKFVAWNATNITKQMRSKLIGIAMDYKAKVDICFMDTALDTLLSRNKTRPESDSLPNGAIVRMMKGLELPDLTECHNLYAIDSECAGE